MIRWMALVTAVAFGCVAYPMSVIRRFRAQGATELAIALVVPGMGTNFGDCLCRSQRGAFDSFWGRIHRAVVVVPLLTAVFAAAGQGNIFERMFRPIEALGTVLAVNFGPASQAYPIVAY